MKEYRATCKGHVPIWRGQWTPISVVALENLRLHNKLEHPIPDQYLDERVEPMREKGEDE